VPVSLLSTKLFIPRLQAGGVSRPRLTEKLLAGVNRPGTFTLLSGPAGFGKTTLLGEFVAQLQKPVAWVSLDEGDNDPIRFWTYLISACQSVQVGVGESALALFRSPQPLPEEAVPTILINDVAELQHNLVLILDDYHVIQNQSVHTAVAFLLDHLPDKLHIVLSTRLDPPWPLAQMWPPSKPARRAGLLDCSWLRSRCRGAATSPVLSSPLLAVMPILRNTCWRKSSSASRRKCKLSFCKPPSSSA
jgi:LuxR family maltose regulon positive regulatory protein